MKYKIKTYFVADLHLGHKSMIKFSETRYHFKDVDEMNEEIIRNWNAVVNKD